jgi:hypothetical protein
MVENLNMQKIMQFSPTNRHKNDRTQTQMFGNWQHNYDIFASFLPSFSSFLVITVRFRGKSFCTIGFSTMPNRSVCLIFALLSNLNLAGKRKFQIQIENTAKNFAFA